MSETAGSSDELLIYNEAQKTFRQVKGRLLEDRWTIELPSGASMPLTIKQLPLKAEVWTTEFRGLMYSVLELSGGYSHRRSTDFLKSTILVKDP